MSRKFIGLLSLCALIIACYGTTLPHIRFTAEAPFTADGRPVKAAWSKADRMVRFITTMTYHAALYQSQAAALFDDHNLYLHLVGEDDPQGLQSQPARNLFANNNFEVFVKPASEEAYLHVAIDDCGKTYRAWGRTVLPLTEIKVMVHRAPGRWQAALTIPFTVLKIAAPTQDTTIRLGIARHTLSTYSPRLKELSGFSALHNNYHLPDLWASALITRSTGKQQDVVGPGNGVRINLMQDPDLNRPRRETPTIKHLETMALSNEWFIRATGNQYFFHQAIPYELKPDTDYTLVVRARNQGGQGNLRVVQFKRLPNGDMAEGPYVANDLALSPEFHDYYLPLHSSKEQPLCFYFYRLSPDSQQLSVDLSAIRLYEGKHSTCEFRQITSLGVLRPIPGTAPPLEHNLFGRKQRPLRVFATVSHIARIRETMELFAGMNVQCDTVVTSGNNQDIYETLTPAKDLEQRLKDGSYDLYMIGARTASQIGPGICKQILKNVKDGAGLWFGNNQKNPGNFKAILQQTHVTPLGKDSYPARSFPTGIIHVPPEHRINETLNMGTCGKGRIVKLMGNPQYHFKLGMPYEDFHENPDYSRTEFPFWRYANAWLARLAYVIAKQQDVRIDKMTIQHRDQKKHTQKTREQERLLSLQARIETQNAPPDAIIQWKLRTTEDQILAAQKQTLTGSVTTIPLPRMTATGKLILTAHLMDAQNHVLDYALTVFHNPGPELQNLRTDKETYTSGQTATCTLTVAHGTPKLKLNWQLLDFSGRILHQQTMEASPHVTFAVPLAPLYTNMGRIRLRLMQDGQQVAYLYHPIYVRDLDAKRTLNDFTPAVWPAGNSHGETLRIIDRQLEDVGIRNYVLPLHGIPPVLRAGMTCANHYLPGAWNAGWYFAIPKQKNNVRTIQFNTAKAREKIAADTRYYAQSAYPYGVLYGTLCDEPGLCKAYGADELDAHPENLDVYRKRMKKKYKTIETYNRRHQTSHPNFHALNQALIKDARKTKNPAEFIEWRNFNVDRWCEAIKVVADNNRIIDPQSKFSLMNTFGQLPFSGNDYWKLLTKTGITFSHEYTNMVSFCQTPYRNFDEFYRSFRPDIRVWGWTGYFFSPERTRFMPWWFAAHRYGGFSWYATDSWKFNLLDLPSLALTQNADNLKKVLESTNLTKGLGKITLDFQWRKNDVAIYYSHDSMLLAFALGSETRNAQVNQNSPLYKYYHSRQGIQYTLEELLWQYDFIAPEQVTQNKLKEYNILFMPASIALSDQEIDKLREFLKRGGRIVADVSPGHYDELGVKRTKPPFDSKQIVILNQMFSQQNGPLRKKIIHLLTQADSKPILKCQNIETVHGREAMLFQHDDMRMYMILRALGRSQDKMEQTFIMPQKGHLYNLRTQKYLGITDRFTAKIPYGDAAVYGLYPYRVAGLLVTMPDQIDAGTDLQAQIAIQPTQDLRPQPTPQHHVFHIQVINPQGQARFHMKRNVSAPKGTYRLAFRMAHNDPKGTWTLNVTDAMTGTTTERTFLLR